MTNSVAVPRHLLGDDRDPSWGDMSRYVIHLTRTPEVFSEILYTGHLKASGPYGFGWARKLKDVKGLHHSVCLSEVPLDAIERLVRRHGAYGIAFTKEFIRSKRGARVWYVDQGSEQARSLNELLSGLQSAKEFGHPIWELTPFMDLVMPGRYEWDWEREWRVRGDLKFLLKDVAFVVTPEGFEEVPGLEGFYVHPRQDVSIAASPQALVDYMENLVQRFSETYENPVNRLPVDGGEYVWIVDEWETDQAVAELFPNLLETALDLLVDYLNSISPSWVLSADVASIYE